MPKTKTKPKAKPKKKTPGIHEALAEESDRAALADSLAGIPPPIALSLESLIEKFRPPKDAVPHISKKGAFLEAVVVAGGIVDRAARAVGINRCTVYKWRERDERFAKAYTVAMDRAMDVMEDEGKRRAFEGTRKGIYFEGRLVAAELQYSDACWLAIMRAHRPQYQQNGKTTFQGTGKDGAIPLSLVLPEHLKAATDEQLRAASERLDQAIADARSIVGGENSPGGGEAA